jgi:hypothetical protein
MITRPLIVLSAIFWFSATVAVAATQSKDRQICITKLNKNALKVVAAQAKANAQCVAFAGKGKLASLATSDAKRCLRADAKGKLAKTSPAPPSPTTPPGPVGWWCRTRS